MNCIYIAFRITVQQKLYQKGAECRDKVRERTEKSGRFLFERYYF